MTSEYNTKNRGIKTISFLVNVLLYFRSSDVKPFILFYPLYDHVCKKLFQILIGCRYPLI